MRSEFQGRRRAPRGLCIGAVLLAILPVVSIYAYWQYSQYLGRLNGNKYPVLLLAFLMLLPPMGLVIFVSPVGLAIVQRELNRIAAESGQDSEGVSD